MEECWQTNPKNRPAFKRVAGLIRADLEDMSHDDTIVNRTNHMQQRSMRSRHGLQGSLRRHSSVKAHHDAVMNPSISETNNDDSGVSA